MFSSLKKTFIAIFFVSLIWSAINPKDYLTWFMEVVPAIIGFIVLGFTYKKFQFTNFTYAVILLHCIILFAGGKYTYAENPLFDYLKELLNQDRNNYDKLGHLMQGFGPTLVTRELFVKLKVINKEKWMPFVLMSITMFISSVYEIIEWFAALGVGESADAFLGTQGYIWDTQSDMLLAFIGSVIAIVFFSRWQDRAIGEMRNEK
jgi:putative membrane protein